MTKGTKIALGVGGGLLVVGVGYVAYKQLSGPRRETPTGGHVTRSLGDTAAGLFGIAAAGAQEYRARTGDVGGGGASDQAGVYESGATGRSQDRMVEPAG